jgi:hypothetical protein
LIVTLAGGIAAIGREAYVVQRRCTLYEQFSNSRVAGIALSQFNSHVSGMPTEAPRIPWHRRALLGDFAVWSVMTSDEATAELARQAFPEAKVLLFRDPPSMEK